MPLLIGNNKWLYLLYMHARSAHFSSAALMERIKAASLRDEAAYFYCYFERSGIGGLACLLVKEADYPWRYFCVDFSSARSH